jgi:serine protease inhibitor
MSERRVGFYFFFVLLALGRLRAADRPFVYAIQHLPSGTCLFLGRVTDPR